MYTYSCKVLKVVDGDTLDLEIDLGFNVRIKERIRLYGVDTPEVFGAAASSEGAAASDFTKKWVEEHTAKAGRSKHFEVNGVRFNSTWEYIVAQYLDLHNIKWTRKGIKPIPYLWNDSWHLYFPDFLIETADIYIEVKGYETERDRVKWKYSDKPVLVIKKKEVDSINNNLYNVQEEINKCSGSQAVKAPTS